MKPRQQLALNDPCYIATDCAQSRFFHDQLDQGRKLRVALTMNVGLE